MIILLYIRKRLKIEKKYLEKSRNTKIIDKMGNDDNIYITHTHDDSINNINGNGKHPNNYIPTFINYKISKPVKSNKENSIIFNNNNKNQKNNFKIKEYSNRGRNNIENVQEDIYDINLSIDSTESLTIDQKLAIFKKLNNEYKFIETKEVNNKRINKNLSLPDIKFSDKSVALLMSPPQLLKNKKSKLRLVDIYSPKKTTNKSSSVAEKILKNLKVLGKDRNIGIMSKSIL